MAGQNCEKEIFLIVNTNKVVEPTRRTRYYLPMSDGLFDAVGPRSSAY